MVGLELEIYNPRTSVWGEPYEILNLGDRSYIITAKPLLTANSRVVEKRISQDEKVERERERLYVDMHQSERAHPVEDDRSEDQMSVRLTLLPKISQLVKYPPMRMLGRRTRGAGKVSKEHGQSEPSVNFSDLSFTTMKPWALKSLLPNA
jgi:hypothetical protein